MKPRFGAVLALPMLLLAATVGAQENPHRIQLDPPGPREFVVDRANLLSPADQQRIQEIGDQLLTEKATPILVVTVNSMAEHNGAGMRIETFATLLFNQWGIGVAELNGQPWNTGILLLVSKNDRQARIELGGHWRRDQDALAQRIMNEQIVPRFKAGDFSGGIVAGVESLDKMARGLELPQAPTPWWVYAVLVGAVALAIFTVVSLIRRGASGWAWLLWGAVFAAIGFILYQMATSRGSGGGYSGGSFGGGFSGGGGATGSW